MNRIYTRTGDSGTTAINNRIRVPKTDIRIEANGSIDELNVSIGIVRSLLPATHEWQPVLKEIQTNLMSVMSIVATKDELRGENPNTLPVSLIEDIEETIDRIAAGCPAAEHFILPGGTTSSAFIHQSRVNARRAERRLWELNDTDPVPNIILRYVNRLSDLFFIMARSELFQTGLSEERWQAFSYKRKSVLTPEIKPVGRTDLGGDRK